MLLYVFVIMRVRFLFLFVCRFGLVIMCIYDMFLIVRRCLCTCVLVCVCAWRGVCAILCVIVRTCVSVCECVSIYFLLLFFFPLFCFGFVCFSFL